MSVREENADCESSERSLLPCIEDADEIWNMITTRLPTTALILQEMEKVINDAQNLLYNFEPITHSQNYGSNELKSPVINDSDNLSIQSNETSNKNERNMIAAPIYGSEVATITANHSPKTQSLEHWNQFGNERTTQPSRPSSGALYQSSPTTSSSSSTLFLNAKSTSTLDQANVEKLTISNPLYEIEKVNALDYENVKKNYENSISITKETMKIPEHAESTSPTMTMKQVMLASITPRICSYVTDSPIINNLNQLEIDMEPKSDIESPGQNLPSSTLDKPSSIPRPISNRCIFLINSYRELTIHISID